MALLVSVGYWSRPAANRLRVDPSELIIARVVDGNFEDVIPLRGQVTPLQSIYLDAIEGGRVEKILVEEGEILEQGQVIVEFSNIRLQLESIAREAQVSEQINLMQTHELNLVRNAVDHQRQLLDLTHRLKNIRQQLRRMEKLLIKQYVSVDEVERIRNEYHFLQKNLALTKKSQAADQALQEAQMKQLRGSVESLTENLKFAKRNLESLRVRAPMAGMLTAFEVQVGQSLRPGERLGQIDDSVNVKVTAFLDEFYKNRVEVYQRVSLVFDGKNYGLRLHKIYPQVTEGRFKVDLVFEASPPEKISRGQNLQMNLQLGENVPARLIPNGAFVQDTGGHWVFVVDEASRGAWRRKIKLGRRNGQVIEVLEGLMQDERIIISPYTTIKNAQQLQFK